MEWKTIEGYEQYEVSNEQGLVRNKKTGRILKQWKHKTGYLMVSLCKDGKKKNHSVHRLVAIMWIPNPDNLETVNHIDHNKENNNADNLEWMSRNNNAKDGSKMRATQKVYCVELDKTFDSIREAERLTGVAHVGDCCQGRRKTAGKMHWKYVES